MSDTCHKRSQVAGRGAQVVFVEIWGHYTVPRKTLNGSEERSTAAVNSTANSNTRPQPPVHVI